MADLVEIVKGAAVVGGILAVGYSASAFFIIGGEGQRLCFRPREYMADFNFQEYLGVKEILGAEGQPRDVPLWFRAMMYPAYAGAKFVVWKYNRLLRNHLRQQSAGNS